MKNVRTSPKKSGLVLWLVLSLAACGGESGGSINTAPPAPGDPGDPDDPQPPAVVTPPDATTNHAFLTDHFSGSENCAACHDGLQDASGADVSIVADWQATMMANGSRDPLWRAKVASEVNRNPLLREEIESACARCHTPMAHVEAGFAAAHAALLDEGFLHPDNPLFDAAAEGISCTLCHQVSDGPTLGTDDGFSGNFQIPFAFGADRHAFGQYANPLTRPMINQVAFTPALSPHISGSEVCASCHNLATPVVDAQGNVTGQTFPEQMVYTEWEHSDFADTQSCQDCHMPSATGDVVISTRPVNGLPARPGFSRHAFVGGNTFMLDLLARNGRDLNISAVGFDRTIATTRALLGGSVSLALEGIQRVGDTLHFNVRLSNHSGHKFPTSFPSRRAWLHVRVTDDSGTTVFESGAINADGSVPGLDSDTNLASYEQHHEVIDSSRQVQSYETIMEDLDGNVTYTLLRAAAFRKDNRLLPAGMDKNSVPSTIRPRGNALADPDFAGGVDVVRYEVAGLAEAAYTIDVRLNFQSVGFNFISDLLLDDAEPRVALFRNLNEGALLRFEPITGVVASIDF